MTGRPQSNEAIENRFDQDDDVQSYVESTPLKPKRDRTAISDESIVMKIEDKFLKESKYFTRLKMPDDTASKDSDSLIHDVYYPQEKYDSHLSWWKHPKVRQNWKIVLAAFVLLLLGLGLVATGILVEIMPVPGFKGFVFFIAGAICFIPGAYHVVYVYCAVKGRRGFDFHSLPLFN